MEYVQAVLWGVWLGAITLFAYGPIRRFVEPWWKTRGLSLEAMGATLTLMDWTLHQPLREPPALDHYLVGRPCPEGWKYFHTFDMWRRPMMQFVVECTRLSYPNGIFETFGPPLPWSRLTPKELRTVFLYWKEHADS